MKNKKTVFLTGSTGTMGKEGFRLLLTKRDLYNLTLLVRPSGKNKEAMASYENLPGVKVVYGDLANYDDVLKCVTGADYVLHVGGMVSPAADYYPELTTKINIEAVKNIIKAIKAQKSPDDIKLVYIGTVAQTGDRNPPIHWGRTGDPIKISIYDNYALSKTIAEREVIESGLKYWVSLRQTGVLYHDILKNLDPIMFHEPLNGVLEWVTAVDSSRLLANVCDQDVPDEFWRRIYNIGGGEKYRTVNWEFMKITFGVLSIKDFTKAMDANWFATQNFHGQWYEDSDVLENYLHFRSGSVNDFVEELKEKAPFTLKLAKYVPAFIMKNFVFKPVANKPFGTLHWFKHNNEQRISAFFGTRAKWEAITSWKELKLETPSAKPIRLDHGYDESKPKSELELADMKKAAEFRGGICLSTAMVKGNLATKLKWECAFGHEFEASPTLVLLGGHWCPDCLPTPWNYDEEAKHNPFFAQVWKPLHDVDEANVYDESILKF